MRANTSVMTALTVALIVPGALQASIHIQAGDRIRMVDGKGGHGGVFYAQEKVGSALVGDQFSTFCVEVAEHIALPGTYYVNKVTNKTSETNNYLTPLAAWIYSDFLDNNLSSFLTGFVSPTTDNDKARYHNTVQMAIWMSIIGLSQTQAASYIADIPGANYYSYSTTPSTPWLNELLNPSNYNYSSSDFRGVQIMNLLTGPGGSKIQDQLVRNTPEPTALMIWALLGMVGLTLGLGRLRT
jgi:hypothetical protein